MIEATKEHDADRGAGVSGSAPIGSYFEPRACIRCAWSIGEG